MDKRNSRLATEKRVLVFIYNVQYLRYRWIPFLRIEKKDKVEIKEIKTGKKEEDKKELYIVVGYKKNDCFYIL